MFASALHIGFPRTSRPQPGRLDPARALLAAAAWLLGLSAAWASLAWAPGAQARPLTLAEIYELGQYVQCTEGCPALPVSPAPTYDQWVAHETCLNACGYAPRLWEKNGVAPVDRVDHELALLEYADAQDPTRDLICYADADETVVIPAALCAGAVCEATPECTPEQCAAPADTALECVDDAPGGPQCIWPTDKRPAQCPDVVCDAGPTHSFSDCADGDADGVPNWLEQALGLDDGVPEALCGGDKACAFDEVCVYQPALGAGRCEPRDCGDAPCTAFHMEVVAEDDVEVIVHVYYDYTPVPARALDLYVDYDQTALTLEDARALPPLTLEGKELASTHLSDGTLRLSVYDPTASHPIPYGPIIELVFLRTGDGPTTVAFSGNDALQLQSVAPLQGSSDVQGLLADDALWGEPLHLGPPEDAPAKLRLWYGFDTLDAPITYANVPTGEELCALDPACANEPDDVVRARLVARFDRLQRGAVQAGETVEGVTNAAVYLDGGADHVRLPVHFRKPLAPKAQSFSFSTWFYTEGASADELKTTPQVLFSHNGSNERTRFGLRLEADGDGGARVVLFDGDLLSQAPPPTVAVLAPHVPLRTWHHVGFALDADQAKIELYFDGERVNEYTFPDTPVAVCPQLFGDTDVLIHAEGEVLGGRAPEFVYYGANRSNLYEIERVEAAGGQGEVVLGDSQHSYRDPDYYPPLDRLVFSANLSGDFEIWTARGDGTGLHQVTQGFGDTARGIAARRPRWAPDGTGIVFESNVYDVPSLDNTYRRVSHLYYVAYDPAADAVAIERPDGSTTDQLVYDTLLANQTIDTYRLTSGEPGRHHRDARWLLGRDKAQDRRGRLLFDSTAPDYQGHRVYRLDIPELLDLASASPVDGLGDPDEEQRLLAAFHGEEAGLVPVVHERAFYERAFTLFSAHPDFTVETELAPTGGVDVHVLFSPHDYADDCWDRNHDGLQETDEDRDGDGAWTVADCYPHEVRDLYIEYDSAAYTAVLEDDQGQPLTVGAMVDALGKTLKLKMAEPQGRSFIRVEVLSPLSAQPLAGADTCAWASTSDACREVAVLHFDQPLGTPAAIPFGAFTRQAVSTLAVKDLTSAALPEAFDGAGMFEQVDTAAFAPDGERLLLAAVSKARPVVLRTQDLFGAGGALSMFLEPTRVRGLDWEREDRLYPCEWAGGYLHLQTKEMQQGLRGGLDDLKIYDGLRDPDAFRSEAARGRDFLKTAGLDGALDSKLPSCGNSHAECPAYHLCVDSECVMVPCDPNDPTACAAQQARCTLRPAGVEQEAAGQGGAATNFAWVCAADCTTDSDCFGQQCLNGPCRFCDQNTHTCIECRDTVKQLGALTIATTEGCPDTKSFSCDEGACVTECYTFADEQSVYLCDPLLEYCDKGKCVLHDWSWWDFAPATMVGLGETRYDVPPDPMNGWPGYSQAVGQDIPVGITAYGVEDYCHAPELLVEAKGGPFYGADWHRLGTVEVRNRTVAEAQQHPYALSSPHPFNDLRVRLVTTPYQNVTGAATGLGAGDDQFCLDDFAQTAAQAGTPGAAPTPCYDQAQGSRFVNGYRVDLPMNAAYQACRDRKHPGCPFVGQGELDFLYGGSPAVAVLDIQVDGASAMNNVTADRVCTYEGGLLPVDDGVAKKVFYGDIAAERSNQKDAYCAAHPGVCAAGSPALVEFDRATYGMALLNCNYVEPGGGDSARIELQNLVMVRDWPLESGAILETANNCTVDVSVFQSQPCYTWTGADVSADPMNEVSTAAGAVAFGSFDFSLFKGFGHDGGYDAVPLPVESLAASVTGYAGAGLVLGWRDAQGALVEQVPVTAGADPTEPVLVTFPTGVKLGHRYRVTVESPPTTPDLQCFVDPQAGSALMASGGAVVPVSCGQAYRVQVAVQGLTGTLVLHNTWRAFPGGPPTGVSSLSFTADGAQPFASAMLPGTLYEVTVASQPAGQRCEVSGGAGTLMAADAGVSVVCHDVVTSPLQVSVVGLAGSGLTLLERESGRVVQVAADGLTAFPGLFPEGDAYDIAVVQQPASPPQLCTVADGAGTMPAAPHVGAQVSCAALPTYAVSGVVVGLQGDGLSLTLNGAETLSVPTPANLDETPTFTFSTPLLTGDAYDVTVASQPTAPDQDCTVALGVGTVGGGDVTDVVVACKPKPPIAQVFHIGGTVTGLQGTGLRLMVNGGVTKLDVASDGPFVFDLPFGPSDDYEVAVDRQPSNPTQVCKVTQGKGTLQAADVDDVQVTCEAAMKVTVEVHSQASDGAQLAAVLVTAQAPFRAVAQAPEGARIEGGQAVFVLQRLGQPGDAVVAPGAYQLYLYVNHDLDYDGDNGKPHFEPVNDRGAALMVAGTASQPAKVVVEDGDLGALSYLPVAVQSFGMPDDSSVRCWAAPAGAGRLVLPPPGSAPVVGKSVRACTSGPCVVAGLLQTDVFAPVPPGVDYDVTCWVDANADNTVNGGDFTGFAAGLSPGQPATIALQPESF